MSEELKDHEYDGIQEYDNPLPAWWLWTFLATIIFGFLYWIHYTTGAGLTQNQELKVDLAALAAAHPARPAQGYDDGELTQLMANAAVLGRGGEAFAAKCAACHGPDLQGLIGPNLVDDYWLHGQGRAADIALIIRQGVPEKGMPTWDGQLKDDEIKALAAFIKSRQGTHPANPKPPQGDKVVRN